MVETRVPKMLCLARKLLPSDSDNAEPALNSNSYFPPSLSWLMFGCVFYYVQFQPLRHQYAQLLALRYRMGRTQHQWPVDEFCIATQSRPYLALVGNGKRMPARASSTFPIPWQAPQRSPFRARG